MFRPTGKSIYLRRKDYSESMNKHPDNFQYRVEHLFTCELDGQEVRSLDDCVARLKRLDTKGRLWGQEMILEVQGGYLQLTDIETKAELESFPLDCIQQIRAVLNSCTYNSLLTVTVHDRNRRIPQVFMFQCEDVGAEDISGDLDRAVQHRETDVEPCRVQNDIRSNLENIIGQQVPGGFRQPRPPPPVIHPEMTPPPPDRPAPQWNERAFESFPPSLMYPPQEDPLCNTALHGGSQHSSESPEYTDEERSVNILNHVLDDVEHFMGQVTTAMANDEKSQKKKKSKKKSAKKNADNLPSSEEFVSCLQKLKYGFNLLGKLNGSLSSPSAPDYVHILFSVLSTLLSHYPPNLPPTVLTPLLTEHALVLLAKEVTPQENQLWRSLGDNWNVPRSKYPNGHMIPPYIPQFRDGWQPPVPVSATPQSQHFARQGDTMVRKPEEALSPILLIEPPLLMRVIYDFMARNNQELSVMKDDVVEVVDKSKQWWIIRNVSKEEGYVPQNVLEPMEMGRPGEEPQDLNSQPTLDMMSSPADVKSWLEYKGFSKLTVRCLGVLSGNLLLGMTKDEIRMVCPEDGGRVFFQLQGIKSAIALASETGYGAYNGH